MSKRTFQPSNTKRHRTHGFRVRMRTKAGKAIINRRRAKGRHRLAVQLNSKAPAAMKSSLPKTCLLTKPWQYKHVYSHGKRVHGTHVTFIFTKNKLPHDRLGISISGKKLAIRRNRIKRLIKEFYRLNRSFPSELAKQESKCCIDLVVSTSKNFEPHGLCDIQDVFLGLLKRLPPNKHSNTARLSLAK